MEENPLKPPLRKENLGKISAKIFGDSGAIEKFEPIPPYRKTNTYKCDLKGKQVILKYGSEEEWRNQEIAVKLSLNSPKIIGEQLVIREEKKPEKDEKPEITENVWFAQEFIQNSKTLNELMVEEGLSNAVIESFNKSTELLAKIHGSLELFLKQTELSWSTHETVVSEFEERLKRFTEALDKYDQIKEGNPDTKRWRSYLERIDKDALVYILEARSGNEVLVRWDYKPDNLLVQSQGTKVFSIDWQGLRVGGRWIDLGFLLSDLSKDKRPHYLETYLTAQRTNITHEEALRNFQTAVVGAQFIHASSNANTIIKDTHTNYNLQRLSDHLNQLGRELG